MSIMKKCICTVCEYIYISTRGNIDIGIESRTVFEDIFKVGLVRFCGV